MSFLILIKEDELLFYKWLITLTVICLNEMMIRRHAIIALSSVSDEFRMVLKLPLGLIRLKQRKAILVYTLDFPSPMTILIPFLVMSSHWTAWDLLHIATCCWRLEKIWRSGLLYQGQCTFCTSDTEDRAIASIAHPHLYIII